MEESESFEINHNEYQEYTKFLVKKNMDDVDVRHTIGATKFRKFLESK